MKVPETWEEFGALYDSLLNSGLSVGIQSVTPNSDPCFHYVSVYPNGIAATFGGKEAGASSDDLFVALAEAADKVPSVLGLEIRPKAETLTCPAASPDVKG